MDSYVLDTNIFFNMEAGIGLGSKTEEVTVNITEGIKKHKKAGTAEFFMPPRIIEEFLSFFEDKEQSFIKNLLSIITVKSPQIHRDQIPSAVFYELIEDIRTRSYRGLSIGEENLKQMAKLTENKHFESKKEFELTIGPVIKNFRERYRQATRFGFLDSLADLDLIMLAREQNAAIVSTDEGVFKWGRVFGVKEITPAAFGQIISAA